MNKLLAFHLAVVNSDIFPANSGPHTLKGILISFIVGILVIAVVAGFIWMIDRYIHVIPDPVKLVAAIILVALVLIWACTVFF